MGCCNNKSALIYCALVVLAVTLAVSAAAQQEVRVYKGAATDATYQWNESCIHGPYVCPQCGYSSLTAGTCPDPWNSHGGTVTLVQVGPGAASQRIVSTADTAAGACDIQYADGNGVMQYLAVVGRPFQRRDRVYPRAAGTGTHWAAGDHIRFLFSAPGVGRVAATMGLTSGTVPSGFEIAPCPFRVTDGEVVQIRYSAVTGRCQVYSDLDGLDYDNNPTLGSDEYTATGAFRFLIPVGAPSFAAEFTVHSNSVIIPNTSEAAPPAGVNFVAGLPVNWGDPILQSRSLYLTAQANGSNVICDGVTGLVVETGTPIQHHYRIPYQAVGIGHTRVLFRNAGEFVWRYNINSSGNAMDGLPAASHPGGVGVPLPAHHGPIGEQVQPADAAWLCSRIRVPKSGQTWRDHNGDLLPDPVEPNPASRGYGRFLVGRVLPGGFVDDTVIPGASARRTMSVLNRWRLPTGTTYAYRCPGCGALLTSAQTGTNYDADPANDCPYCLTDIPSPPPHFDGSATLADYAVTSLTPPPDLFAAGRPTVRPVIPASAVKIDTPAGTTTKLGPNQTAIRAVQIDVPAYQPPSDPTPTLDNHLDANWGYRGMMMVYNDENGNGKWDVFYRDPLSGVTLPATTAVGTAYGGTHAYCPTCGAVYYGQVPTFCPFDGTPLVTSVPNVVAETDLACEEFDVYDLQISVLKHAVIAHAGDTVDIGRVSPGVDANLVDTTVSPGGVPGLPPGRAAFGSDTAAVSTLTRNEGNMPLAGGYSVQVDEAVLTAAGAGLRNRTLGRWLLSNPLLPDTFSWWLDGAGGVFPPAYANDAGGVGYSGGVREGRGLAGWPVPLGQASGNYAGQYVAYLENNGVPGLQYIDRTSGAVLTAGDVDGDGVADNFFDPRVDEPLEPVFAFNTRLRVAESRFPYSGYYSTDTTPVLRMDHAPSGAVTNLQVLWSSNRDSVSGSGATMPGGAAPPSTSPASAAMPGYPLNILVANAAPIGPGGASHYRGFAWSNSVATAVTADKAATNPGTVNSAPVTYEDADGNQWLIWHRSIATTQGTVSALQYDRNTPGATTWPNAPGYIYASGLRYENACGFADPQVTNPATGNRYHWLFWHSGPDGGERLYFRWAWDPADGSTADNEGPLPVDNSAPADAASTVVTDYSSGISIKKPSHGPFVYTKDPSAFYWNAGPGAAPQVHVFFSGYLRYQGNADICWVKYAMVDPGTANVLMTDPTVNYGKLTFPRVQNNDRLPPVAFSGGVPVAWPGEEMNSDGMRQSFSSRHLDWMVHDNGLGDDFGSAPNPALGDPQLYIGLVYAGATLAPEMYAISWSQPDAYDQARGVYRIQAPLTSAIGTVTVNPLPALPAMEIDPAAGTVTFSRPLFDPNNPADVSCALNTTPVANGGAGMPPGLVDVVLYIDYTPFIWRLTTSGANDDCPNAFLETDPTGTVVQQKRLSVFWRRTYSHAAPPHFGRTSFMYRAWTLSVQVNRPPVSGNPTIEIYDRATGTFNAYGGVSYVNSTDGIITFPPGTEGRVFRITYNSAVDGSAHTETHRVLGWSEEVPVAVDTVTSEGPLSVVQEVYQVASGVPGTALHAVRYWLFWSSARSVYDLRLPAANGSDIKQSADIYCATFVPDYATLVPQVQATTNSVDG